MKINQRLTLCFSFLFCLLSISYASAQQLNISGVVISSEDNEPLIGATVSVKGNPTKGVITDINGQFQLSVETGTKMLVVSYVGMKTQEIRVPRKEKELKIAFSLPFSRRVKSTKKIMQNIAHSSSLNGKVPRAGSVQFRIRTLIYHDPRSQRPERVHSLFLLRIYQRRPVPARNGSGCICAQQYPDDDLCFQYGLFRYSINARFRHKERWKGISLPRQKRNGKEYAQRIVAEAYPRL